MTRLLKAGFLGLALAGLLGAGACGAEQAPPKVILAYQGCLLNAAGYVCSDAMTCQASLLAGSTGAFCSRTCTIANMCPPEMGGRTVGCFQPMGASGAQCYVTCPSASSTCPQGTMCRLLMSAAGTALPICVPLG